MGSTEPTRGGGGRFVWQRVGALAAVFVAAFLLLDLASQQIERFHGVSAFFPSDGLALALIYVVGLRMVPVVCAAYALSSTLVNGFPDVGLMVAASAVGAILHGTGGFLLRARLKVDLARAQTRDLTRFLLVTALVASTGAVIITGTLLLTGDVTWGEAGQLLFTATVGLNIGILVMATPALLAADRIRTWLRGEPVAPASDPPPPRQRVPVRDALLLLATTAVTVLLAFAPPFRAYAPMYLCFLPIILLALRRGLPGAAVAVVVVDSAVVVGFYRSGLPLSALDQMQLLLLALSLTGLILGSVVTQRQTAEGTARQAEVLRRELALARQIQTSVLPGFEVAGSLQTASQVGGDFYDVVPSRGNGPGEDVFWITIGDVCGHGMDAGLVMLMAQAATQAILCARPDAGPAQLVAQVNRVIHENLRVRMQRDEFVTFMAVRHQGGGRFVAAGGHLPIYLVRRDGQVSAVEVPGLWCGLLPDIEHQLHERAIELAVGDLLCLVTDGVLEARDERGECYGDERLLEALGRLRAHPADQVLAQVLSEVRSFQRAQEDDITAVLLKRTA